MFITFEGIDGCGKTTQAALLAKYLSGIYGSANVVLTREPGGTSFNEFLRDVLLKLVRYKVDRVTELLLFIAMRRESFVKVVVPNLLQNKIVISDRCLDSTVAYQGYGFGIDLALIEQLNSLATEVMPDITFIIDVSTDKAMSRAMHNGWESKSVDFYSKVKEGFKAVARENPHRCCCVDCTDDETGDIYAVHRRIIELFHKKCPRSN